MNNEEKIAAVHALMAQYKEGSNPWKVLRGVLLGFEWAQDPNNVSIVWVKEVAEQWG